MPSLGPLEIVVILVVALLVFGPNKLPEVGRQVGRAMRELRHFQETMRAELHDVMQSMDDSPPVGTPPSLPPVTPPGSVSGTASHAPSRFRAPGAAAPAHAPSRFRAPKS